MLNAPEEPLNTDGSTARSVEQLSAHLTHHQRHSHRRTNTNKMKLLTRTLSPTPAHALRPEKG
eukprot:3441286-Prorocentrum_lima.AAC.1